MKHQLTALMLGACLAATSSCGFMQPVPGVPGQCDRVTIEDCERVLRKVRAHLTGLELVSVIVRPTRYSACREQTIRELLYDAEVTVAERDEPISLTVGRDNLGRLEWCFRPVG